MNSFFGPLTRSVPDSDPTKPQHTVPAMRFEDADTLFILGEDPNDCVFAHSEVLAASSKYFKALLTSEEWDTRDKRGTLAHPLTGRRAGISVLELRVIDNTLLLERKVKPQRKSLRAVNADSFVQNTPGKLARREMPYMRNMRSFPHSCFATPGMPRFDSASHDVPTAIFAIKTLLALLYGAAITAADLLEPDMRVQDVFTKINRHYMALITTVVANAEFFDCLPSIRAALRKIVMDIPDYWVGVGFQPKDHVLLAIKLECAEIYHDAMRHLVSQAHASEMQDWWSVHKPATWEDVAEVLSCSVAQARSQYVEALRDQTISNAGLMSSLHRLTLSDADVFRGSWHKDGTTLTQVLQFARRKFTGGNKKEIATEFLAKSIFGQWLKNQLHGKNLSWEGFKVRAKDAGRANLAVERLQRAATWANPANLFGVSTPNKLLDLFTGFKHSALQVKLVDMVKEANSIIESDLGYSSSQEPHGVRGQSRYKSHPLGYFTNLELDHTVPWPGQCGFMDCGQHGQMLQKSQCDVIGLEDFNVEDEDPTVTSTELKVECKDTDPKDAGISTEPISPKWWAVLRAANPVPQYTPQDFEDDLEAGYAGMNAVDDNAEASESSDSDGENSGHRIGAVEDDA